MWFFLTTVVLFVCSKINPATNLQVICRCSWRYCELDWRYPSVVVIYSIECLYLMSLLVKRSRYQRLAPMLAVLISKRYHVSVHIGSIFFRKRIRHFYHLHRLKQFQPSHQAQNVFLQWMLSDRDDDHPRIHVDRLWIDRCLLSILLHGLQMHTQKYTLKYDFFIVELSFLRD